MQEVEMPEVDERHPLKILGRTIGTYSGWDGEDLCVIYYAFKPVDVLAAELPEGDINVEYENGYFSFYDADGQLYKRFDMIAILSMIQRDPDASAVQS